jgi:RNA polymerase sigma factor (sigma-70 family)
LAERKDAFGDVLLKLTNQTLDELWPEELRLALVSKRFRTQIEQTRQVGLKELACNVEERLVLPSPADQFEEAERGEMVRANLNVLTPRQKAVVKLRYGVDGPGPLSLTEIGLELRITKDRVRQILTKAMQRLRKPDLWPADVLWER